MDNSKNSMNNDKSLCLYCDKAFSNINDQGNHVERDHKAVLNKSKGSLRKSERITKNLCSENSPFAACFYCNNRKLIKSDDLDSLFQHLLAAHNDIYFGCKCKTRLYDKVSLANHKKNCELGGDGGGSSKNSDEKSTSEKRKSQKTSQSRGSNDLKCDTLSDSTVINSTNHTAAAAASSSSVNNSVKALPTNAINKKSDRSNVKNSNSKNVVNSNEKRNNSSSKKSKLSNFSSSSSSTSSSSSSKTTIDEYTIPLTRQKLKEPTATSKSSHMSRSSSSNSNKKVQKNGRSSSSTATSENNKNASSLHATSSSSLQSPTKVQRTKTAKVISHNLQNNCELVDTAAQRSEAQSTEFDDDFYKNISYNIRVNLNSFIDGKIDRLELKRPVFDRISVSESTDGVQQQPSEEEIPKNHDEKEIHEATNFELSTPFPALLTAEQYGFGDSNPKKRQITKNSWKWRWDLIKKYKYVNEGGKIVKKVKQITTGLKDLSQLDMWTQLSMRSRYESLNNQSGTATTEFDDGLNDSLSTRMIKTQNIEQLNTILDKRLMPEINIEQLHQTLVKEELVEADEYPENIHENEEEMDQSETLGLLNLARVDNTKLTNPSLSGEWARPRFFICIECGQEFDLMKSLTDHKNSEHPYVVSTHYEVVGRENLEQKLYKNLFLPKKALQAKVNEDSKLLSINSDSKSNEASTTSSENSSNNYLSDQKEKECSKCMKTIKYSNDIDIYRHILDCIEDRVWMQAKRRNKYRRSRRKTKKNVKKTRLPNDQKKNTSSPIRKDIVEGENGDNSLSNPPTPKDDKKPPPTTAINPIKGKTETYVNDAKANNDGMNIKSFFRVSKTTPNLPQKIVVQMIEMHQNNAHTNSLRHSLRSAARKTPNSAECTDKTADEQKPDEPAVDEMLKEEEKSDANTINNSHFPAPIASNIPPALTALQIPDTDKIKSLTSPTNSSSSSLVSPTSLVPKKKKKLNDCIAMLTCKIQEKLGVNFFENSTNEIFPTETTAASVVKEETISVTACKPSPLPLIISDIKPTKTNVEIPDVPWPAFTQPEQDEVIDLSIKKKPSIDQPEVTENQPKVNEKANDDDHKSIPECDEEVKQEKASEPEEEKQVESPPKDLEKCNENTEKKEVEEVTSANVEANEKEQEIMKTNDLTESFKISISKDRIPNLNEILQNSNSVITVNKLTISESERRAFEEQKNRIMQILNKTKKTPTKKAPPAKKNPPKKAPAKKATKQQPPIKEATVEEKKDEEKKAIVETANIPEPKTDDQKPVESTEVKATDENEKKEVEKVVEPPKKTVEPKIAEKPAPAKVLFKFPDSDTPERELEKKPEEVKETPKEEAIQTKIEQAIKTTNRIRCRRLSVVVDPILHLSPFSSSNRKIRLTNNSQQNGFYELLTNDQLFNAIKPQLKDEIKKTCAKVANKAAKNIQNAIKEVRAITAKVANELSKDQTKEKAPPKNNKSKAKGKKKKAASKKSKSKNAKNKSQVKKEPAKVVLPVTSSKKVVPPVKGKQVAKNTRSSVPEIKPVVVELPKVVTPQKQPPTPTKTSTSKAQQSKAKKPATPLPIPDPVIEVPAPVVEKPVEEPKVVVPPSKKVAEKPKPVKTTSKAPAKSKSSAKGKQQKIVEEKLVVEVEKIEPLPKVEEKPEIIAIETTIEDEKLDASISSDASNENDIPLAKLVSLSKEKIVKEGKKIDEKEATPEKVPAKAPPKKKAPAKKAQKSKTQSKSRSKPQNKSNKQEDVLEEIQISDEKSEPVPTPEPICETVKEEDVKLEQLPIVECEKIVEEPKVIEPVIVEEKVKEEEIDEKPAKKSKGSSKNEKAKPIIEPVNPKATAKNEKENFEKVEVFTINEDSFFNDDNDADEKINDLVNNIINSSELVDSETEKTSDHLKQNMSENQVEAKCLICKRTFKNAKVLEKHNMTSTHLFKVRRREKRIAGEKEREALKKEKEKEKVKELEKEKPNENHANATSSEENKIFRTKGALKTFENILAYPSSRVSENNSFEPSKEFKPLIATSPDVKTVQSINTTEKKPIDHFIYDEEDDKNEEDLSRKDKIFDSLFSNIENKLQAAAAAANSSAPAPPLQKFAFPTLTPHDSEVESSSTSWDLKHDADIEWDADNNDNNQPAAALANVIKEKFPKKTSVKINKSKETAISIPTKSLIMGKIFKKHRDREKQKTPQADAPNNKPGIKNSLDEIFDHLKNSAEIDDKVLTCPSPKTLLKSSGGTFSPHSSHSNDMLETASQSNNNNNNNNNNGNSNNKNNNNNNNVYTKKPIYSSSSSSSDKSCAASSKENNKTAKDEKPSPKSASKVAASTAVLDDDEDGIGKRKSRRRCAIKAKTFAETWSSDEYEELHDTNDIISIINEIEKRESINNKKRKVSKSESHFVDNNLSKKSDVDIVSENHSKSSTSILKTSNESMVDKKSSTQQADKKKSVQLQFRPSDIFSAKEKPVNSSTIRKRRMSTLKDGHKSDEETFTATKDLKPLKPTISMMKKRRMSCFVPSSIFNDNPKPQANNNKTVSSSKADILSKSKIDKELDHPKEAAFNDNTTVTEKSGKAQKKILSAVCNNTSTVAANISAAATSGGTTSKKKIQKHRKRPRTKVKNIAYDSDSDFELNLSRKSKAASTFSDSYSEEEEEDDFETPPQPISSSSSSSSSNKVTTTTSTSQSSSSVTTKSNSNINNELTMIKEPKLLPNDLNVVTATTLAKAAIPTEDIHDPTQSACNRTKRHSSEKLYYWSSSSESDVEPGDTADGENEDSMIPQQPEQHGWIVGDSHKKLVTLLAHAKIKNKIN